MYVRLATERAGPYDRAVRGKRSEMGSLMAGFLFIVTVFLWRSYKSARPSRALLHQRPAAHVVQSLMANEPKPADMSFKQYMYENFKHDVARGRDENRAIPHHGGLGDSASLRVISFNVHYFRAGYSDQDLHDSTEEVMQIVSQLNPDLCLLQEVPATLVPATQRRFSTLGYAHSVAAGSADVHVLAPSSASFAGERLHVMVLSKLPLVQSEAVPMLDGFAAHAEVALSNGAPLLVYSLHLSVRCVASKRHDEVQAVIAHARAKQAAAAGGTPLPVLIAGDFNQQNEPDYPAEEWRVIAADMARAQLSPTDGVMRALRASGYTPSFEAAAITRPLPPTSAWNGAVVDYCYVNDAIGAHSRASLAVEASYVYYTLASDHLPLVTDLRVGVWT